MRHNLDPDEMLAALRDELDYQKFLRMKEEWLTNVRMEWLIIGHLTSDKAKEIVEAAQKSFKFNELSEEAI